MKLLNRISKYCFGTKAYRKRIESKRKLKRLEPLSFEVILFHWEHQSWGNRINLDGNGRVYGHISGVRNRLDGFTFRHCDLRDGDILVYEIAENQRHLVNGDAYVVGYLANIEKCSNPQDMFFANFKGLFTTSDVSDVRKLAKEEIARLKRFI